VFRSQLFRRALAVAATAAAATAAALAVSAPASAHESFIESKVFCDQQTGHWVVSWTVKNGMKDVPAELKDIVVTPEGTAVAGIEEGTDLPAGGFVVGVQRVPGEETSASLSLLTKWVNGKKDHAKGEIEFEGTCEDKSEQPPTPTPTATPTSPASPPGEATPTPSTTPAPGAGGGLPVTGSAVGGTVAAAAALLVLGVGLFLVARRRRIRFTA
jgi:LPXTG-motif cell wall-anchored protein